MKNVVHVSMYMTYVGLYINRVAHSFFYMFCSGFASYRDWYSRWKTHLEDGVLGVVFSFIAYCRDSFIKSILEGWFFGLYIEALDG